jgi:acetolactate decarboxylase
VSGTDNPTNKKFPVYLSQDIFGLLEEHSKSTGESLVRITEQALRTYVLNNFQHSNSVYLSAPVNAMMKGFYQQNTTIRELHHHGDFGLGTFNNLDGEMVMLDGRVYQLHADGYAYEVDDTVQTPFACVTFFSPDTVEEIEGDFDDATFNTLLKRLILSENMLYAIRVDGLFSHLNVWSVSKQENYRPVTDVGESRSNFIYENIEGTMAGFYTPKFIKSLNMPGFHLHFMSADRKRGGHVHECRLKRMQIALQHVPRLTLNLPITLDYLTAQLPR